jgi:hypothetical protein
VHVRSGQDREPDDVGILLESGGDDLLGCLAEAGVDHLHAGIAQGSGDDLRATIVAVETRFRNHHSDGHLEVRFNWKSNCHGYVSTENLLAASSGAASPDLGRT